MLVRYAVATAFCALFGFVYEQFSHGVWSRYMMFFFAVPLVGGLLPAILLASLRGARLPRRLARDAWASAVATLTVGCCLAGVFEIYGTTSDYVLIYAVAGGALAAVAAGAYVFEGRHVGGRNG